MNLLTISEPDSQKTHQTLCIGIDFGTTNSVCSIKIKNKVEFIYDQSKKILIPSVVHFGKSKISVGNDVLNFSDYSKKISSIKRKFTKEFNKKEFKNHENLPISAVEVAKEIFIHLKICCDNYLDNNNYNCVLTVPAYYDEKARSGIMRSAFMAGFNIKRLINEPTAAAFAYGLEKKKRGIYLVYDLGGGTFDVSILQLSDGIFKVIGTGGDVNLGGDDFDYLISEFISREFFDVSFNTLDEPTKSEFILKIRKIKEKFGDNNELEFEIELSGIKKKVCLSRNIINSCVDELIDKTIVISEQLIQDCEINLKKMDGIIMVGGSTRLRRVSEKINVKFNKKIFNEINPDLVVSKGAALHGYELINGAENLLLDVTPLSLGIETMGGLMEKIISRNSAIPCVKQQTFTTHENGQTTIKINILQGERETKDDNRSLGEFILKDLEPKPAGIPRILVTFSLDADGILFVSATDELSGNERNIIVKANNDLSLTEMRTIIESSISNAKSDINTRMLIEAKMKGQRALNEINSVKTELELLCSKEELNIIKKIVHKLNESVLMENIDSDKINSLTEKLNESTKKFAERKIEYDFSNLHGRKLEDIEDTK